jgi:hypothetical protein
MPRHPASSFDFSKYQLDAPAPHDHTLSAHPYALAPSYEKLPTRTDWPITERANGGDSPAARTLASYYHKKPSGFRRVANPHDLAAIVALQGPALLQVHWHENFDHPVKRPFGKGRRQSYFIGEGELGPSRGVHRLVARSYRRTRPGVEYVRLQNSWGHDYPLVWVPLSTLRELHSRGEFDALAVQ